MAELIENRTFDELEVGDSASVSHVLTKRDIQIFAYLSGDVNPAHLDEEYAREEIFHEIIGHGMWSASLISNVLGTQLPGPGTIYLDQSLRFVRPVKVGDTITAQVTVKEKINNDKQHVLIDCCCRNQNGKEVLVGEAKVIAPDSKVRRRRMALPQVEVTEAPSRFYEEIIAQQQGCEPIKTAVAHPVDVSSLKSAIDAARREIIEPILVGPEHKIRAVADQLAIDLSPYRLVTTEHSHEAAAVATAMARRGEASALMKGKLHTDELLKAVLDKQQGLRTDRKLSHVTVMDVPTYHKPLLLTDAAINIEPTLSEKCDILQNAIDLFLSLDRGAPKVAIVSAVETVNEAIPSTLDAAALCKMADRGQISGAVVDGPLAFDNAISVQAAQAKNIVSPVAGDADILLVPNIEAGNLLYKQMSFLSKVEAAGVVMGARVPIILTSRATGSGLSRMVSCAIAAQVSRSRQKI